jgi:hypothetical protein
MSGQSAKTRARLSAGLPKLVYLSPYQPRHPLIRDLGHTCLCSVRLSNVYSTRRHIATSMHSFRPSSGSRLSAGLIVFTRPKQGRNMVSTSTDRSTCSDPDTPLGTQLSAIDGQLIAVKDNICTTDFLTTCASGILRRFTSPFNATVVELLEDAGAIVAGKTNLDEFGMGSHSTHSYFGPVTNQLGMPTAQYSAGGSSGGSAVAVMTGQCIA